MVDIWLTKSQMFIENGHQNITAWLQPWFVELVILSLKPNPLISLGGSTIIWKYQYQ